MRSNPPRTVFAIATIVLAIGGLGACGSDDETTAGGSATSPTTQPEMGGGKDEQPIDGAQAMVPTIVVRDGEPVGGIAELEYDAGEQVRFHVSSNAVDEVHVHGYELSEEVAAGGTVSFSFPADIEGIFEVELHGSEKQIAELRVNP